MKIIADTNLLVRFLLRDDENQFQIVCKLFAKCEQVIIPTHVFCELIWVLSRAYRFKLDNILEKIELLLKSNKVNTREDEVEAGLVMMRKGGDFADGVNAYTGREISTSTAIFASFDQQAIRLLSEQGIPTLIPD